MGNAGDIYLYLDRAQCSRFQVPYFEDGSLQIGADALLRSKDYDLFRKDILVGFGFRDVYLSRVEKDNPGWYLLNGYSMDVDGNVTYANA